METQTKNKQSVTDIQLDNERRFNSIMRLADYLRDNDYGVDYEAIDDNESPEVEHWLNVTSFYNDSSFDFTISLKENSYIANVCPNIASNVEAEIDLFRTLRTYTKIDYEYATGGEGLPKVIRNEEDLENDISRLLPMPDFTPLNALTFEFSIGASMFDLAIV